jgi:23S rRNA (adenine2503-C2)-methyltransferase
MPVAKRYPLPELMAELRRFPLERGRRITFEYVLIGGLNDSEDDARALAPLLKGIPAKLNLIPFNPDEAHLPGLSQPAAASIDAFAEAVRRTGGFTVTVRWSKGLDVSAACGQLKGLRT